MPSSKIFTIGSATFDIFVKPGHQAAMTLVEPERQTKWLCLEHGGKVKIDQVIETFGGGAANTAVAFARQGHEVYFVGKVGAVYGKRVLENLQIEGVHTDHARQTSRDRTGFSTIINTLDGDRTVLGYAGANRTFTAHDLPLQKLARADWIFLSHISGDSQGILKAIERLLKKNPRVRLAWNPGHEQLRAGLRKWKGLLSRTQVLFVNKEEASLFTRRPYDLACAKKDPQCHVHAPKAFLPPYADDVTEIMLECFKAGVKTVVITDGRNGAQASDGKRLYFCPVVSTKRVDTLGAGDAFASGFVGALLKGLNLKAALKFGTLNANSVVNYFGAQKGLLKLQNLKHKLKEISLCVSSAALKPKP